MKMSRKLSPTKKYFAPSFKQITKPLTGVLPNIPWLDSPRNKVQQHDAVAICFARANEAVTSIQGLRSPPLAYVIPCVRFVCLVRSSKVENGFSWVVPMCNMVFHETGLSFGDNLIIFKMGPFCIFEPLAWFRSWDKFDNIFHYAQMLLFFIC